METDKKTPPIFLTGPVKSIGTEVFRGETTTESTGNFLRFIAVAVLLRIRPFVLLLMMMMMMMMMTMMTMLLCSLFAVKDESYVRQTLQRQTATLHQAAVSYAVSQLIVFQQTPRPKTVKK